MRTVLPEVAIMGTLCVHEQLVPSSEALAKITREGETGCYGLTF